MNEKKFLDVLNRKLRHLPKEDRADAIAYYEEYFAEMNLSEDEDVTLRVGQPEKIAKEIVGNCTEKHLDEQKEKGGIKNGATVIWMILLGICASPIAIPIAAALIVLLFACVIVVAFIILAFGCMGAGILAVGIFSIPCIFWATGFAQKMVCFGMGGIAIGFGILFLIGVMKVGKYMVGGIAVLFRRIFSRKKVD